MEQFHDALAFGRFVGGRRLGRQASNLRRREAIEGRELGRPAIAHGDRSRLVQEQRIDVARHFHRFSALGHDVGSQGAVHARDADGRQKRADRGGNQADQQGHQRGHVGAKAQNADAGKILHVQLDVVGNRPERGGHDEEDQREHGQHDRQGDFVGRPLADGPFDQGNHAVEEGAAGAGGDLDDDPIREHPRAPGNARAVPSGLADHGGRLAGDRRFINGSHAFDDFAVAGDDVSRGHFHLVSRAEFGRNRLLRGSIRAEAAGRSGSPRLPQGVGLGLAAGLGNGGGEVGEQQCRQEPEIQGQQIF